jgi:antitoxin (DNA-binding transcriptional repressor) of toxin-antitoxin stability system
MDGNVSCESSAITPRMSSFAWRRGERLRVTVDRRPVPELAPLPARETWVPRARAVAALVQSDAALSDELAATLGDTVDQL